MEYLGFIIGYLLIWLTPVIGLWHKGFPKMGRKSWEAFVPFYNYFALLRATNLPWYWVIFFIFPGIQFIMWASLNVTYIRKFGKFGIWETVMGVLFPFPVFYKIANDEKCQPVEDTNWDIAKQVDARTPSDHVALFFTFPILANVVVYAFSLLGVKRKPGKKSIFKEWGDAIIFAVVAASAIRTYVFEPYQIPTGSMEKTLLVGDHLFVDKFTYGPRLPMTPFSYPIFHNMFPFLNVKSYIEFQKIPYTRFPGLRFVDRYDVVVFNFPAGDTALNDPRMPNGLIGHTYEQILRDEAFLISYQERKSVAEFEANYENYLTAARKRFTEKGRVYSRIVDEKDYKRGYTEINGVLTRPVDKRENYIKRCVGMPGDVIQVVNQILLVNAAPAPQFKGMQIGNTPKLKGYYQEVINSGNPQLHGFQYYPIFPNDKQYDWTEDNFGPLRIPAAGDVVELNHFTLPIYRRIITAYEGHSLAEKADGIYIDGVKTDTYTIEQNYYWLMGDNRNNSADSRFWGFVPEDHIVGHAAFIWLSVDPSKGMFGGGMRWNRMFSGIE